MIEQWVGYSNKGQHELGLCEPVGSAIPGFLGCCLLSRFCLFFSKAPTKQAPWSEELCKCAAKRYLAKWNIDRSVTRGPSGLIAEDSYTTMSVFESLLLCETCTIVERGGWEFCSRNELIVRLVWHRLI